MLCVCFVYAVYTPARPVTPFVFKVSTCNNCRARPCGAFQLSPIFVCLTVSHDHELTGWKDPERGEIAAQADLLCTSCSWSLPAAAGLYANPSKS